MTLHREIKIDPDKLGLAAYRLGPARLHLDEVQMIYKMLRQAAEQRKVEVQEGESVSVRITAGEAWADDPEDLRDATKEEMQDIQISVDDPLITADLGISGSRVAFRASDSEAQVVAAGIRNYVNSKPYFKGGGFRPFRSVTDFAFVSIVAALAVLYSLAGGGTAWVWGIFYFALLTSGIIGSNVRNDYRLGMIRVVPRRRNEARGLNSDFRRQLLIALVGAIVGAAIIGLAGLWAGFYHHP